jgi:hypothetical protein
MAPYSYSSDDPIGSFDAVGLVDCNHIPQAPPGVDIKKDIQDAQKRWDPFWYYDQVKPGGPWDYKRRDLIAMRTRTKSKYEEYGNFSFGATAAAFGFPRWLAKEEAGRAQKAYAPYFGHPFSGPPWGDDPGDQRAIDNGYDYYENCFCQPRPPRNFENDWIERHR